MACNCKPSNLGPGTCDAEVSELVSRGEFGPDRLTVVERRLYELEARLIAVEQRVYAPRIVPLAGSQEARDASRKALAEAEQKMRETEVEIDSDAWEAKWMDL